MAGMVVMAVIKQIMLKLNVLIGKTVGLTLEYLGKYHYARRLARCR